ncbi:hypothetical protein [uncultured Vibrio sp.]|uniref:hypothetical protein n=1 Tax=uncultured Vibrio sp. TaxID=114054 RepID=UPI00262F59CB|nr:hypothetical protein [uncultured Vibrio sp.]
MLKKTLLATSLIFTSSSYANQDDNLWSALFPQQSESTFLMAGDGPDTAPIAFKAAEGATEKITNGKYQVYPIYSNENGSILGFEIKDENGISLGLPVGESELQFTPNAEDKVRFIVNSSSNIPAHHYLQFDVTQITRLGDATTTSGDRPIKDVSLVYDSNRNVYRATTDKTSSGIVYPFVISKAVAYETLYFEFRDRYMYLGKNDEMRLQNTKKSGDGAWHEWAYIQGKPNTFTWWTKNDNNQWFPCYVDSTRSWNVVCRDHPNIPEEAYEFELAEKKTPGDSWNSNLSAYEIYSPYAGQYLSNTANCSPECIRANSNGTQSRAFVPNGSIEVRGHEFYQTYGGRFIGR